LDTGSYGLRVFKQALGSVSLTQVKSGSGSLAECITYADNSSTWGPVQMADVILGNEPAVQVPIQVIDSTFGTIPPSCGPQQGYTPATQPSVDGYNGILGVGPSIQDCGSTCVSYAVGQYYKCGSSCSGTTVPLSNQVSNPVASLPLDSNNGLIVELPGIAAGGTTSVTGSLVFGIGTQSNNLTSGVTAYTLDQYNQFTTTFNNVTYNGSFIDTGSNEYYFSSSGILPTCTDYTSNYCPSTVTSLSAIITGASGSPSNTVSFRVGNFSSLWNAANWVFDDVAGELGGTGGFDWGLPFYFGRNVYIGFEGMSSSLGTGPYFAY
jgi:hypothetical protein